MDLSLKKLPILIAQDIPQDLSIKKPRAITESNPGFLGSLFPTSLPVKNTKALFNPVSPKLRTILNQGTVKSKTLADQNLRTLAHQKAKTLADQNKVVAADLNWRKELIVPKPTALVIPKPRKRKSTDLKPPLPRDQTKIPEHKPSTIISQNLPNIQSPNQGLDLRKKTNSLFPTVPLQFRSSQQVQNKPFDKDETISNISSADPPIISSSNAAIQTEETSQKRRRKQEYPKKRIKLEHSPRAMDPTNTNKKLIDRVTDAAQNLNGKLEDKGTYSPDAFLKETAQGVNNLDNGDDGDSSLSDSIQTSQLESNSDDGGTSCEPSPPLSTDESHSCLSKKSSSKKLKLKKNHTALSLQNREKRKTLRLYGKAYTTPSGKTYPQRKVQNKDCSKCRYSCSTNIKPEQREAIFQHFWSLDSYVKRLYYYCQSIKEKPAKTMTHTRECSREYTFLVEGQRVRVCKGFYLATLDVSDKAVRIAMEKRKRGKGMWDKRGAHPPHNKTRPEDKDRVRSHIESFLIIDIYTKTCENSPTTPGQDLNITKMHQDYVEECKEEEREPVSEDVYRRTFNIEYNLSTVQV